MRKLKLLGALLAVMAVVASSTLSPAMANHWDDDDDEDEGLLDGCFLGTREVDQLVWEPTIFGYEKPEVVTLKEPCDDEGDDDDDDWHDDDDNHDFL